MTPAGMVPDAGDATLSLAAFLLGTQRYALHLDAVVRVLPMIAIAPLPEAPPVVLGVINLHGTVIPVLDPRPRLGMPALDREFAGHLLVARTKRRTVALPVDEVLGPMDVSIDQVAPIDVVAPDIVAVAGTVALADGVLFIHDLERLLSLEEEQALEAAFEGSRQGGARIR